MSTAAATGLGRLQPSFGGFPGGVLPPQGQDLLGRYCLSFDVLGRLDAERDAPLVDQHTLRSMLTEFVGRPRADQLVGLLAALPGAAFRPAQQQGPPAREAGWFDLASKVAVFDGTPGATFGDLDLPARVEERQLMAAVNARYPSIELEFLDPDVLPPRLQELYQGDPQADAVLRGVVRQLGWWAGLTAILLVPPASLLDRGAGADPSWRCAWPLGMHLLACAIGGWTLTVVGAMVMSPVD